MKIPSLLLACALSLAAGLSATAQNLVVNGDFETAPFDTNNTVTSWTVTGSGVVLDTAEGATSPSHSAAFRPSGGVLSQTLTTTAGQSYSVDFDAGVFGAKTGSVKMRVQAIGTSTLLDQTVTPAAANTSNPDLVTFLHFHFTFTADSTSTILRFTDTRSGNTSGDNLVDTISVTVFVPPTPTPTPTPTATQ